MRRAAIFTLVLALVALLGGCGGQADSGTTQQAPEGMLLIPAGKFTMGDLSGDGQDDERPAHTVYVDAFYMDRYEVTNGQFCEFLNERGNRSESGEPWLDIALENCLIEKRGDRFVPKPGFAEHPVVEVSWSGASACAQWAGKRLPTEAEWEYACRAGTKTKYNVGEAIGHDYANYYGTAGNDRWESTSPVGSFAPNAWGLCDMHGNAWEWCSDWFDPGYYRKSPKKNPGGRSNGQYHVVRGGSCESKAHSLRSSNRSHSHTGVGFRCVKDLD